MSNVLIGIIGVVLFIGLALAGALLLGSDFMTATTSSKAATITQQMQQAAAAANMYQLKTGQTIYPNGSNYGGAFLVPRFLKATPTNMYFAGAFAMVDSGGSAGGSNPVSYWYYDVGTDSIAKAICRAIEEGEGASNPDASQDPTQVANAGGWSGWTGANKRMGCLINAGYSPARYQAYIPV